jgi:hypothetical protein
MPIDFSSRVEAMVAEVSGDGAAPEAAGEPVTPGASAPPDVPAGEGSPAASAAEAIRTPEQIETERVLAAKRAVIEEKLAAQREKRMSARLQQQAAEDRRIAAAEREAATKERARYDSLKQGTFRETIAALGRDPREVFEEMQREAIEASTPEAELKRLRADFEKQMGEKLQPLQETIEELRREREALAAQANHSRMVGAFQSEVADPAYIDLRAEYDDAGLFAYVRDFVKNPQSLIAAAREYGVQLTDPSQGFTMREILNVLKSAQDAHDRGKQERRSKFLPASAPGQTQPGKPPTVNGTAARSNAGTPIGNDLADERAAPPRKLSRKERIQAEIDRVEKR